jgi:RNA polymerase sigma factor (sigma-70 family)
MSNDTELLRRYVEERAEGPFTQLVQEHLNLVYSAALREMNGDRALAEDVSQAVFTELARKAPRLLGHPSLAGWLYSAVRHLAANWRRADQHRRHREEEAHSMNELLSEHSPNEAWQQVRPVLDDALHELNAADREAIVLRFMEDRPLREVGARLGLNENAARMRVDRALDKLRSRLARRGITSTASGLAAALAIGVLTPAPAALAGTIASAALAGGVAVSSTTLTLMKLMSLTTVKASVISTLVVAGIAVPAWQQTRLQRAQAENAQLRAQERVLLAQGTELTVLRDEVARLRNVGAEPAELEQLRQWKTQTQPELLRLRGMAGVARRANAEAEQLRAQLAKQGSQGGTNPITAAMMDIQKQGRARQVEADLSGLTARLHLTPEQSQAVHDILLRHAQVDYAAMDQQYTTGKVDKEELARLKTEAGDQNSQIQALLSPDQKAVYASYKQEKIAQYARWSASAATADLQGNLNLTSEQADRAFAALYPVTVAEFTRRDKSGGQVPEADRVRWKDEQAKALESILTPAQLQSYRQLNAAQTNSAGGLSGQTEGDNGSK